jgi:hypothetical protein
VLGRAVVAGPEVEELDPEAGDARVVADRRNASPERPPELTQTGFGRPPGRGAGGAAAGLRKVALLDAVAGVEADICTLLDRERAAYLDDLGKRRGPAEKRVAAALGEAEEALVELAREQAAYAYLDDWPDVSRQSGAYAADGVELPLRGADGAPLSVGALPSALREAAGRPRRGRPARPRQEFLGHWRCSNRRLTAAHTERRADGLTRDWVREPLRAGRSVLDLLGPAQGIHRFADGQEDCRLERAERTAATNRQRNRGHGRVVGGLP